MANNASDFARRTQGAPREGAALLTGLVVCGRCGRQMRAAYKPGVRYFCNALSTDFGSPMCLHLDGPSIEAAVVAAFFEALAPAELDLLDEVLAAERTDQEQVRRQHAEQVARAEYEARLAQKQYLAVDPDNRLVAAELERRWEQALLALAAAREAAEHAEAQGPLAPGLAPELRAQLRDLGPRLPELWAGDRFTTAQRKDLLRCLIRRVVLTRPLADRVDMKIVWMSGAFTLRSVRPPIWRTADLGAYERVVARVGELSGAGYQDREIARRLTAEGLHAARSAAMNARAVGKIRRQLGQASLTEQFRRQAKIGGCWTVWGLARALGVERDWLYRRISRQQLPATRHPTTGHYLIADDPALLARLRDELADQRQH